MQIDPSMERVLHIISNTSSLKDVAQIQTNAANTGRLSPTLQAALDERAAELGLVYLREKSGRDLDGLSPAEERITQAVSAYVGIKVRDGSNANRTIKAIRDHGLLEAAEIAVTNAKPTAGFQTLNNAGLAELSYEQIIVDHPEEFSARALWFARRTLGLDNETAKPPARGSTPIQEQTDQLLAWLKARRTSDRRIPSFTNAEASAGLGWDDLQIFGRAYGNLQSRLDFACYRCGLPPLGLTAERPFDRAWSQEGRTWAFPVSTMQLAAQTRPWIDQDFRAIGAEARALPGQAHVVWRRELAESEARVRTWAEGLTPWQGAEPQDEIDTAEPTGRNPAWTRDELILALDLYWTLKGAAFGKSDDRILELSSVLSALATTRGVSGEADFRNANGVYMKLMNFRAADPEYAAEGKIGLSRGNQLESVIWSEFFGDRQKLQAAAEAIRESIQTPLPEAGAAPYWVFVCNPKRWAIDRFLEQGEDRDTWGVRPSDRTRFAPGQLGVVRVGVDRRTSAEREGRPALEAGIYALVEIESEAFEGSGASDAFWAEGGGRGSGWPTVKVRYLQTFSDRPLTITRLREEAPALSPLLLNGFQAASFPIPEADFRRLLDLLGTSAETVVGEIAVTDTLEALARLEEKFRDACPEVKERVSRSIERGPVGALVKKLNGYKCQICQALGRDPIGFLKPSGEPYVEAHHVMPVSAGQAGSLGASNILTACATHHRQLHYGQASVSITATAFDISLDGKTVQVGRPILDRTGKSPVAQNTPVA